MIYCLSLTILTCFTLSLLPQHPFVPRDGDELACKATMEFRLALEITEIIIAFG